MTSYIVLGQDELGSSEKIIAWTQIGGPVESVSAEAAVRKVVKEKGGTYVAVPVRSWSPIRVKVETKRVLTLS